MHNSDYYREQAAKYRKLAEGEKNTAAKQEFFELAASRPSTRGQRAAKGVLLMEKRQHCRFNELAFGALVGVQFVAGVFGFNPKKPHPRLALWTIGSDSGKCGNWLINDHSNSFEAA